jgi:2-methylisocitrate lyase-like PEP mutase family enzyme
MTPAQQLRVRLAAPTILIAPGVYDAFSAVQAERAGFEAVFASGSAMATAHLARPDIGLLDASEIAGIVGRMAERLTIPVLVDADQGFGNAHDVYRTTRMLEMAGVSGIQIEDQAEIKPPSDPLSRPLISAEAMQGKIKAAKNACRNADTVISARTDAKGSEGLDAAIARAAAYAEAGADMLFIENLPTRASLEAVAKALGGTKPLLHNMFRPSDEVTDARDVEAIGFSMALFPTIAMAAAGAAIEAAFAALKDAPVIDPKGPAPDRVGAGEYLGRFK